MLQFELSSEEITRYSRQLILANWGLAQQTRLSRSSVLIPGELHLAAFYLCAAGVGSIKLLRTPATAELKPMIARLGELNPHCAVSVYGNSDGHSAVDSAIVAPEFALWSGRATYPMPPAVQNAERIELGGDWRQPSGCALAAELEQAMLAQAFLRQIAAESR